MTEAGFLLLVVAALDAAGVPYMIVGSRGASMHGLARTTQDVDIVIDPNGAQLESLLDRFNDDFYVSRPAARNALAQRRQFNVIHLTSGWKADFIVRKDRPFNQTEFARRTQRALFGAPLQVASPEDLILSKLEWDQITPSERQRNDALQIATVNWRRLDLEYLRHWAAALNVDDSLSELLRRAETQVQGDGATPQETK